MKAIIRQLRVLKFKIQIIAKQMIGTLIGYTGKAKTKTPVFIIGCQRSGTTMLNGVLDRSSQVQAFGEGLGAFGDGVRLLPKGNIRYLIYRSPSPIVVFKPLNDTQQIDHILEAHPNSRAIWIFRNYYDVSNSMVKKWGETQKAHIHQIATGRYSGPGAKALGERISPENKRLAKKLDDSDLSAYEAAAFIWFIRNSVFFDHRLERYNNLLVCKYEDMVINPENQFRRIFDFIGTNFSLGYIDDIRSSSISKNKQPVLRASLKSMCDGLMNRLDDLYQSQLK